MMTTRKSRPIAAALNPNGATGEETAAAPKPKKGVRNEQGEAAKRSTSVYAAQAKEHQQPIEKKPDENEKTRTARQTVTAPKKTAVQAPARAAKNDAKKKSVVVPVAASLLASQQQAKQKKQDGSSPRKKPPQDPEETVVVAGPPKQAPTEAADGANTQAQPPATPQTQTQPVTPAVLYALSLLQTLRNSFCALTNEQFEFEVQLERNRRYGDFYLERAQAVVAAAAAKNPARASAETTVPMTTNESTCSPIATTATNRKKRKSPNGGEPVEEEHDDDERNETSSTSGSNKKKKGRPKKQKKSPMSKEESAANRQRLYDERFSTFYQKLVAFKEAFGHTHVNKALSTKFASLKDISEKSPNDTIQRVHPETSLHRWLELVKSHWRRTLRGDDDSPITPEQIDLLIEVGVGTREDGPTDKNETWENYFAQLIKFRDEYGHTEVSGLKHKDTPYFSLAGWANTQRACFKLRQQWAETGEVPKKGTGCRSIPLSDERLAKLRSIGFRFGPLMPSWDERFQQLCDYKAMHGHTQVPVRDPTNGKNKLKLGQWAATQKDYYHRGKLDPARIAKLESIHFDWRNRWASRNKNGEIVTIVRDPKGDET